MGKNVGLVAENTDLSGYLAVPDSGGGPGVVVVQEWWGLVPQIRGVCDRLAEAGFVALAPDLFHGEIAAHTEMDKAAELMATLPPERAAADMSAAVDALLDLGEVEGDSVGILGFCMGGMLTFLLAANAGARVHTAVPFYGFPSGDGEPGWSSLTAKVRGHMAERDDFFPPERARALEAKLRSLGKDIELKVYPGTGHGFMNEENPLGNFDAHASELAWAQALEDLRP